MNGLIKRRTVILFWIFLILFFALTARLADIQVFSADRLSSLALSQQSRLVSLELPPRGELLDRRQRTLIKQQEVWRAVVFPEAVVNKEEAEADLAGILNFDSEAAGEYLRGQARVIPMDLTTYQVSQLRQEDIPGIIVSKALIRDRKPPLAGHILGYLGRGYGVGGWVGQAGLEQFYDKDLTGNVPRLAARLMLDGKGRPIKGLGYRIEEGQSDRARKDVVLTIDRDIQEIVEGVIDRAGVRDGAVVVMEAESGDIVAMASRPDYYLEVAGSVYGGDKSFLNHCLSSYQPGSVFKVMLAAAALDEGVVKPDTLFLCTGEKDELVRCYQPGGHGLITFAQAVAYSCNPVFARVGLKLGPDRVIEYARKFGFADTGIIGYRGNTGGKSLEKIRERYNLVNASLGQWPVEATAVQVTAMMRTIAAGGSYVKPRLVLEVKGQAGNGVRAFLKGTEVQAVSPETAEIVRNMLEMVTRYGTGKEAYLEAWGSAGKTGSAQTGGRKVDAWFCGYAPLREPSYVATVLVTDGESGGKTAAPIFREIMQEILTLDKQKN